MALTGRGAALLAAWLVAGASGCAGESVSLGTLEGDTVRHDADSADVARVRASGEDAASDAGAMSMRAVDASAPTSQDAGVGPMDTGTLGSVDAGAFSGADASAGSGSSDAGV